ncbi:MAG TPA: DoxX family protein, partial [Mucilaginibacter sp.]
RDLAIQDAQRNDFTKELLASPFYSIIIVAYDLDKTNESAIGRLNALAINATENYNIRTILLTSASAQNAEKFAKAHKLVSEIFYADGVPLKTMIRSNPGVILLKNGVVINKWHYHSVPTYDYLVKNYFQKQ